MRSLLEAVQAERRALLACLVILGGLMIVTAALMHVVEGPAQPDKFGSIPEAMYWSIITLTTVGYGDVHPVTVGGKMVAGCTAVLGLVMLSLPVGIIATSFAEVIHRRDFVVTWNMVARVPLFSALNAGEIAMIMRFLRSRLVEGGEVVVRRDEPSVAMFFIASGTVEIEMPGRRLRMETGQFFRRGRLVQRGASQRNRAGAGGDSSAGARPRGFHGADGAERGYRPFDQRGDPQPAHARSYRARRGHCPRRTP